ncbi:cysteinyl-tRNA synthetase, partial [Spiromyces aspiralis]
MTTKSAAESPSPTDLAQKGFEFVNNNKGSKWFPPVNASPSKDLVVYNSITKSKVPFIPKDGKHVSWYGCGPTVYDAAHVGHARNYVTFDILRRIMQDYFGYEVEMVMNITDIDDKIILRGRHAYLLEQKKKQINGLSRSLIDECRQALIEFARAGLGIDVPSAETLSDTLLNPSQAAKSKQVEDPKYGMKWKDAVKSLNGIKHAEETLASGASSDTRGDALALIDNTKDILAPILDKKYGHEVNDPKVFRDLAAYWEADFMQDMDRLNVRRPDVLTRVSEFVPEIVTFIEKIIENGYAYVAEESNGDAKSNSVYFDVHAFDSKPDHTYAKLEPKSRGNTELLDDGEGSLGAKLQGKRHPHHFALWKASKPGEPAWPSPWGMGRPGWHIECSVMASEILGKNIDIHSGGIDLAFPHHDNELAQSEAHFDHKQWVNYFMHAGHLHIEGSKMSKSLKNFISIKEALK